MPTRARLYIVCSDRPRNGKTLLARLIADWLEQEGERPLIVDLDGDKRDLARHLPAAEVVNLQRTPERVAMFDAIVADSTRNVVMEVPASQLARFLKEGETVGFFEAVRETGPVPLFLHVVDRGLESIRRARALAERHPGLVRPVRNLAIGDMLDHEDAAALYLDLFEQGEIVLPRLSRPALDVVERPGFSFAAFMAGRLVVPSRRLEFELRDVCSGIFEQLRRLRLSLGFDDLRSMGLV